MIPNKNILSHSLTSKVCQHFCILQVIPRSLKSEHLVNKIQDSYFFDVCHFKRLCSVSAKHVAHSIGQHEFAC